MRETVLRYSSTEEFFFHIYEEDSRWMRGHFNTDAATQQRMRALFDEPEEDKELWYLDEDGNPLDDDALFAITPWRMLAPDGSQQPVVNRFQNLNTGETWFCKQPWVSLTSL